MSRNLKFNNQKLIDYEYFEYKIKTHSLYLTGPVIDAYTTQYIAKIGDFGTSVKYGPIMIGDDAIIYNHYTTSVRPNWYNKYYDVMCLTRSIFKLDKDIPFIRKILCWMEKIDDFQLDSISKTWNSWYPDVKTLEDKYSHVSPEAILTSKAFFGDYFIKPPEGSTIAVLGEL